MLLQHSMTTIVTNSRSGIGILLEFQVMYTYSQQRCFQLLGPFGMAVGRYKNKFIIIRSYLPQKMVMVHSKAFWILDILTDIFLFALLTRVSL